MDVNPSSILPSAQIQRRLGGIHFVPPTTTETSSSNTSNRRTREDTITPVRPAPALRGRDSTASSSSDAYTPIYRPAAAVRANRDSTASSSSDAYTPITRPAPAIRGTARSVQANRNTATVSRQLQYAAQHHQAPITFSARDEMNSADEESDFDEQVPEVLKASNMLRRLPASTCLPDAGTNFEGIGHGVMRMIPGVKVAFDLWDSTHDFHENENQDSPKLTKYSMSAIVSVICFYVCLNYIKSF